MTENTASAREIFGAKAYLEKLRAISPECVTVRKGTDGEVVVTVQLPADVPMTMIFGAHGDPTWPFFNKVYQSRIAERAREGVSEMLKDRGDNPIKRLYVFAIAALEDAAWVSLRRDPEFFRWFKERFPRANEHSFRADAERESRYWNADA